VMLDLKQCIIAVHELNFYCLPRLYAGDDSSPVGAHSLSHQLPV
jgi:hypothetical protein